MATPTLNQDVLLEIIKCCTYHSPKTLQLLPNYPVTSLSTVSKFFAREVHRQIYRNVNLINCATALKFFDSILQNQHRYTLTLMCPVGSRVHTLQTSFDFEDTDAMDVTPNPCIGATGTGSQMFWQLFERAIPLLVNLRVFAAALNTVRPQSFHTLSLRAHLFSPLLSTLRIQALSFDNDQEIEKNQDYFYQNVDCHYWLQPDWPADLACWASVTKIRVETPVYIVNWVTFKTAVPIRRHWMSQLQDDVWIDVFCGYGDPSRDRNEDQGVITEFPVSTVHNAFRFLPKSRALRGLQDYKVERHPFSWFWSDDNIQDKVCFFTEAACKQRIYEPDVGVFHDGVYYGDWVCHHIRYIDDSEAQCFVGDGEFY